MKNTVLFFCFLCLTTQLSAQTPSVNADEEAIKKVISDESDAFLAGDANKVRTYFNFQPYAWGTVTFANGMSLHEVGESFSKFYDRIKPNPNITANHTDYVFRINGNQAWVTNIKTDINKANNTSSKSHQLRCFEKANGVWKIVALSSHPINVPIAQAVEEEAIKKLIIDEGIAFNQGNIDAFMATQIDAPYLIWTVTNGGEPGDVLTYRGYKALKEFAMSLPWFKNFKPEKAQSETVPTNTAIRDNWNFQFRGNVAIVNFDEHWDTEKQKVNVTVIKVLEKINGNWKITNTSALADFKDATPPIRSKY